MLSQNMNTWSGDLLLDLRTLFPPPAHDIHTIRILGKEVGQRLRIVAVPGLLQARFQFVYHGFVLTRVGTECGQSRDKGQNHKVSSLRFMSNRDV